MSTTGPGLPQRHRWTAAPQAVLLALRGTWRSGKRGPSPCAGWPRFAERETDLGPFAAPRGW